MFRWVEGGLGVPNARAKKGSKNPTVGGEPEGPLSRACERAKYNPPEGKSEERVEIARTHGKPCSSKGRPARVRFCDND
jgi:hypothetical protein